MPSSSWSGPFAGQPARCVQALPARVVNAGHTDAAALTLEIKALGYRGSDKAVRRYLHPFCATLVAAPAKPVPPSAAGDRVADPPP